MKTIKFILFTFFAFTLSNNAQAQFLEKLAKKAQKKIEQEAEKRSQKRVNKAIDGAFDKAEEGIDDAVSGNNATKQPSTSKNKKSKSKNASVSNSVNSEETQQDNIQSTLTWNSYDFVPGSEIIFEDNQQGEQNGEFPNKWDLVSGVVENANLNGENTIYFRQTGNFVNGITPLLKNPSADYLPDEFTVEFDAYFEKGKYSNYRIYFYDAKIKSQKKLPKEFIDINVNRLKYSYTEIEKQYPNTTFANIDKTKSQWRHIAISFNKRALKAYLDETRLLNIPNITENLTGITIGCNHANSVNNQFIKNIRIAKGAVPLYDKVLTDGKFVTTGIKFDVNKATIKPESMGTINYVVKMMQDNPDLNFSIEGHTDSDGSDATNQTLSEQRAKAVKNELIKLGISSNRLSSKGWGESKPMVGNDTPEGKAQNRRVEFVKQK